jgi:ribosomal protein S18 acetylase RimI-like enzyme
MIKAATAEDRDDIIGLWEACGLTRPWNDPNADFDRAVEGPASAIILFRLDGEVAASVMVGHDGHRGWVYYLAVAPDRRREGLGRRMMAAAEEWLRDAGAPKIQLMVRDGNAEAIAFYEAIGLARQPVVTLGRFFDASDRSLA